MTTTGGPPSDRTASATSSGGTARGFSTYFVAVRPSWSPAEQRGASPFEVLVAGRAEDPRVPGRRREASPQGLGQLPRPTRAAVGAPSRPSRPRATHPYTSTRAGHCRRGEALRDGLPARRPSLLRPGRRASLGQGHRRILGLVGRSEQREIGARPSRSARSSPRAPPGRRPRQRRAWGLVIGYEKSVPISRSVAADVRRAWSRGSPGGRRLPRSAADRRAALLRGLPALSRAIAARVEPS